jgi:hypothetical protein
MTSEFVSTDGRYYGAYTYCGDFVVEIGDGRLLFYDRWAAADELGVTFVGAP